MRISDWCSYLCSSDLAIVAIWAGSMASSTALIGFGLDSVVEVLSAAAVAWQFTRKDPERWEKPTVRAIGIAFFALAAYVIVDAILTLTGLEEVDHSPLGIGDRKSTSLNSSH